MDIRLINDLDGDGTLDPGEPGLEGWQVDVASVCGDTRLRLDPTDSTGRTSAQTFGERQCVIVRHVGWVMTAGPYSVDITPGETTEVVYLFRKVAQQYFRLTGDLIVDGLPAPATTAVDAVVSGQSCGDAQIGSGSYSSSYTLYVLSAADRPGCATEGMRIPVTVDGEIVHEIVFTSNPWNNSELTPLVLGPSPMWFYAFAQDGHPSPVPYVGSLRCGEAREVMSERVPRSNYAVYVLPDAIRSGCGATGRVVTLRVGDEVLKSFYWQEGKVDFDTLEDAVILPPTGTATAVGGGRRIDLTLGLIGLFLLAVAVAMRRRVGAA